MTKLTLPIAAALLSLACSLSVEHRRRKRDRAAPGRETLCTYRPSILVFVCAAVVVILGMVVITHATSYPHTDWFILALGIGAWALGTANVMRLLVTRVDVEASRLTYHHWPQTREVKFADVQSVYRATCMACVDVGDAERTVIPLMFRRSSEIVALLEKHAARHRQRAGTG